MPTIFQRKVDNYSGEPPFNILAARMHALFEAATIKLSKEWIIFKAGTPPKILKSVADETTMLTWEQLQILASWVNQAMDFEITFMKGDQSLRVAVEEGSFFTIAATQSQIADQLAEEIAAYAATCPPRAAE